MGLGGAMSLNSYVYSDSDWKMKDNLPPDWYELVLAANAYVDSVVVFNDFVVVVFPRYVLTVSTIETEG